jgi:hypothetical protein
MKTKTFAFFNAMTLFAALGIFGVVLAVLVVPRELKAQGSAVQYTFTYLNTSGGNTVTEAFQFTTPYFITSDGNVDAASLNYCSVAGMKVTNGDFMPPTPCDAVAILPSGPGSGGLHSEIDVAEYWWTQGCTNFIQSCSSGAGVGANYFPLGSFSSVGEYDVVDSNSFYTAHLSVTQVAAPIVQLYPVPTYIWHRFQSFTANLELQTNGFLVNSEFVAYAQSQFSPLNSPVALRVGPFFASIPAGSFAENNNGSFEYAGTVNGAFLEVVIVPLGIVPTGNAAYSFQVQAKGVDLSGVSTPVYLALLIDNSIGAAVMTPMTTATPSPSPNINGWNNTNITINLNATGSFGGSEVEQIQYFLSGAENLGLQTVAGNTASVTVSAQGITKLTYFATDNAGNQETAKTLVVQMDETPPVISGLPTVGCIIRPPNHKLVQVATVTASDALAGLLPGSFKVSGTSNDPADGQILITGGPSQFLIQLGADKDQIYTLTATASDLAGNTVTQQSRCSVLHD